MKVKSEEYEKALGRGLLVLFMLIYPSSIKNTSHGVVISIFLHGGKNRKAFIYPTITYIETWVACPCLFTGSVLKWGFRALGEYKMNIDWKKVERCKITRMIKNELEKMKEMTREEVIDDIADSLKNNRLPTIYKLKELRKRERELKRQRTVWEEVFIWLVFSSPFLLGMWLMWSFFIKQGVLTPLYYVAFVVSECIIAITPLYHAYSIVAGRIREKKLTK